MMASVRIPGTHEEIQDLINRKLSAKVCSTPTPKFPEKSADTKKKKEFLGFASRNSASTLYNATSTPSGCDNPTLLSKSSPATSRGPSPVERSKSPHPHSFSLKQSNSIRPVNGFGSNEIGSNKSNLNSGINLNGGINHNLNIAKKSSSRASSPLSRPQSPSGQRKAESPIFYKNDKPLNRPVSDFSGYTVQSQNVETITIAGQTYVQNQKANGDAAGKKTEKGGKSKKSPLKKDPKSGKKDAGGGRDKKSKTPVDNLAAKEQTMEPKNIAGEQSVVVSNGANPNIASEAEISEPVGLENECDIVIRDDAGKTANGGSTESDSVVGGANGNEPQCNGNEPQCNGNKPQCNGNEPQCNGNEPQCNGDEPQCNGDEPQCNGNEPQCNGDEPQCNSPELVSEVRQIDVLNEIAAVPPRPMGRKKKASTPTKARTTATARTTIITTTTALKAPEMFTAGLTTFDQRTSTTRVPPHQFSSDTISYQRKSTTRVPPHQVSSDTTSDQRTSTIRIPPHQVSSDTTSDQRTSTTGVLPQQVSSDKASGRGRRRGRGKGKNGVGKSSANSNSLQAAAIFRSMNFGKRGNGNGNGNGNKSDYHTNGVANCYKTDLDVMMPDELKWERSNSSASTAYGVPPPKEVKVDLDADDFSDGFYSSTMKKTAPAHAGTLNGASLASAVAELEDEVNVLLVDPGGLIPHPIKASLSNYRFDEESPCPMCRENGVKAKLRFCFVALEEGVWMCLTAGCPFPFGLETNLFCFTQDMEKLEPEIRDQ